MHDSSFSSPPPYLSSIRKLLLTECFVTGATFSSNVTVVWQIEVDAQSKSADAVVGSADNGFQSFTIHKDTERLLATNADGFQMFTVYYAV